MHLSSLDEASSCSIPPPPRLVIFITSDVAALPTVTMIRCWQPLSQAARRHSSLYLLTLLGFDRGKHAALLMTVSVCASVRACVCAHVLVSH